MKKLNINKISAEKDGVGLNAPLDKKTLNHVKKQVMDDMDRVIKSALKEKMSLLEWQKQNANPLGKLMGRYMGLFLTEEG